MADDEEKLVATSDEILAEVRELRRLEAERRVVPVESGRFRELADAIVRKSRQIMRGAVIEDELGAEVRSGKRSIEDLAADPAETKEAKPGS